MLGIDMIHVPSRIIESRDCLISAGVPVVFFLSLSAVWRCTK